jgi:hypothetical protein
MTTRERVLATVFLVLVIAGGGAFLFKQMFLDRLRERRAAVERLQKDIQEKELVIAQVMKDRTRLDRMRQLSLPQDVDMARREYEKYLSNLLRQSGFAAGSFRIDPAQPDVNSSPKLPGARKEPVYTVLPFTVAGGRGDLASLVEAMERFYHTGLLHRIKSINIRRPLTTSPGQRQGELDVDLTVEALIVNGADNRPYLLPNLPRRVLALDVLTALRGGPPGLALAGWSAGPTGPLGPQTLASTPRLYASIAGKDIFHGPSQVVREDRKEEVDPTRFTKLVNITQTESHNEAIIYDQYNNRKTRLRVRRGYNTFPLVRDGDQRALVLATVVQMKDRDVILATDLKAEDLFELGSRDEMQGFHSLKELNEAAWKDLVRDRRTPAGLNLDEGFWKKWNDERVLRPADRAAAVVVDRAYWEELLEDKKVLVDGSAVVFPLNRLDLLRGRIFYKNDKYVCLTADRPHYALHVGQSLEEGLRKPLRGEELKTHGIVATVDAGRGDDQ